MNPLVIVGIVALLLGAGVAVEGKLLLDSQKEIGGLKVEVANRDAIIKQKEHDAKLSEQLANYQARIEGTLRTTGNDTRQAVTHASTDDDAAVAAIAGVLRLRAAAGGGSAPPP